MEDNVTSTRLEALNRYWKQHPPLHLVAAALAGIKGEKPPPKDGMNDVAQVMEVASMFSNGVLNVR